jgi:hypothetical protein
LESLLGSNKAVVFMGFFRGTITSTSPELANFIGGFVEMRVVHAYDGNVALQADCICRIVAE